MGVLVWVNLFPMASVPSFRQGDVSDVGRPVVCGSDDVL